MPRIPKLPKWVYLYYDMQDSILQNRIYSVEDIPACLTVKRFLFPLNICTWGKADVRVSLPVQQQIYHF